MAVLTCNHNLCFGAKIRKNIYLCKPQFYYIKVDCKGVFVTRTCFRDGNGYTETYSVSEVSLLYELKDHEKILIFS